MTKLTIAHADAVIANGDTGFNVRLEATNKWGETKLMGHVPDKRFKFVEHCISNGLSYSEIAEYFGYSRQFVYQLWRYGYQKLTAGQKEEIRRRQEYSCAICHRFMRRGLHVHHKAGGQNNRKSKLVALCPRCHRIADAALQRKVA